MENWGTERFEDSGEVPLLPIHIKCPKLPDPCPAFHGRKEAWLGANIHGKAANCLTYNNI